MKHIVVSRLLARLIYNNKQELILYVVNHVSIVQIPIIIHKPGTIEYIREVASRAAACAKQFMNHVCM